MSYTLYHPSTSQRLAFGGLAGIVNCNIVQVFHTDYFTRTEKPDIHNNTISCSKEPIYLLGITIILASPFSMLKEVLLATE